ncbi:hypothetical protein Ddye_006436 [Dipteronia dyeriana]|uniref:RNase H type-1 domain-containing protein n=1 Tax=Dipteronia dyeriana TaxID=168575 RepID=A0AAD9XJ10_9ROSI|nr:hypothetical protein Ddye_006436 [Dipteronia dyeriana]
MGIYEWAVHFLYDFRSANKKEGLGSTKHMVPQCWKVPHARVFKINTDAALNTQQKVSGIGLVIRDCNGHNFGVCYRPEIAEAMAILRGLQLALKTGLVSASLESDALTVVNMIGTNTVPGSDVGVIIYDILGVLGDSCFSSITFVPRLANKVAHSLAKPTLVYKGEFVWLRDCPLYLESLVLDDIPSSL